MPPTPLILLPPSEGKAPGGDGPPWTDGSLAHPELDDARAEVATRLARAAKANQQTRATLFGVKGEALAAATAANKSLRTSPTLPAIRRFTGVLYDALSVDTLSARDRRRLDAQVFIFSGLFGVLTPSDAIPDHRLKMSVALPGLGRLSTWWRPRLDAILGEATARRTVWNLLPNEHDAAWSGPAETAHEIGVRFLDDVERKGTRALVTVSHWNKLLKGALVRYVLAHQLREPDGLARFEHPQGYVYRPELTETVGRRTVISLVARRA